MISIKHILIIILAILLSLESSSQSNIIQVDTIPYKLYPEVNDIIPDLPSPFINSEGNEFVIAVTKEEKYAIISVTLNNDRGICPQLVVDTADFPMLVKTGLHSEDALNQIETITGRPIERITELGHPNGLSHSGFMAEDEGIISVIKGDNRIVSQLGSTHPQMAKPLFHVLNMMDADLSLNRWNMAIHQWDNIHYFFYNDHKVFVEAGDTKGGQKSIFDDNIEGAFHVKIWREFDAKEAQFLKENSSHISQDEFNEFKVLLSFINMGEMEPQYIMRYGFYEGHTFWRADPIAISFIFGIKTLDELYRIFDKKLYETLTLHHTE